MKKSNFALRLPPSLMDEARKLAKAEGVAVNQLINVAVAEKLSALRTEEYFAERAARGDLKRALGILKRAGVGNPPVTGDELTSSSSQTAATVNVCADQDVDRGLRFAIANKRLVELSYAGRIRTMEPHDYGVQKGIIRLLAYQRGASGSGEANSAKGWRLLEVSRIERCVVLEETFAGSRGASHQRHY